MTTLLTFRDNVKTIYCRYDYIFTPIVKFIFAFCIFLNINSNTGYMSALNSVYIVALLSFICAFLSVDFIAGFACLILVLQCFKGSIEACLVGFALIMIFYCGYMRFSPKTGVIVFLIPICYMLHLTYAIPIVLGFLIGPLAMVPVAFGLFIYNFELELQNLVTALAALTEEDEKIQGYQYIINALLANKEMLMSAIIFSVVILITYIIYRRSFEYSWIVAFVVGGVLNIVLFLVGSVMLSVKVNIAAVVFGSIAGILISLLIQFFKGVVDYSKAEIVQFEDDNYYYYVKAVPKLSVSEKRESVKHINSNSNK